MAKKKKRQKLTQMLKDRWLPSDNTRPSVFEDKKKKAKDKPFRYNQREW